MSANPITVALIKPFVEGLFADLKKRIKGVFQFDVAQTVKKIRTSMERTRDMYDPMSPMYPTPRPKKLSQLRVTPNLKVPAIK